MKKEYREMKKEKIFLRNTYSSIVNLSNRECGA